MRKPGKRLFQDQKIGALALGHYYLGGIELVDLLGEIPVGRILGRGFIEARDHQSLVYVQDGAVDLIYFDLGFK